MNHPLIKKLAEENKLVANKRFIIRYGTEDETTNFGVVSYFNQDNSELEILEV